MEPLGAASGDAKGASPLGVKSPPFGGKFWRLSDEDEDSDVVTNSTHEVSSPEVYRRPSPEIPSISSSSCPLLAMPKPVAITYGVCRNELIFHEILASPEVTFKHDSRKVGKISVDGGNLTSQEIVNELEWIIPGNHQWDLQPTLDGAFKVLFPSKADLARMTKIIKVPVSGTNMFLHFEEWSAADVDPFSLTAVWVRVHGCCYKERCDYLSLFGVGSLIGKAKEVDMEFTRAHSVVRMKVEVTRVEHIPTTTVDHVYDGEGYGLLFKVEGAKPKDKSDVVMQEANLDDDSKDADGKGKEMEKGSDLAPMGGSAKSTSAQLPNLPKPSSFLTKQAHDISLPMLRVGRIDCTNSLQPKFVSRSDTKVLKISPRRLWGDSDNDDEDSLPSPLPHLNVVNDEGFHVENHVGSGASDAFV
ncbi:hypothetical protein ACQ4PT_028120 [Festuca glaucescens]